MKKSHWILMLLCCALPVVALTAVYVFKVPLSSILLYGMILLCPLSHIFMMKFMMRDHGTPQGSDHAHHATTPLAQLQDNK